MSAGFPGTFLGTSTVSYRNIGAVQKRRSGALGFPRTFPGTNTTSYTNIGAVQKPEPITATMAASESGSDTCAMSATFTAPVTDGPSGGRGPRQLDGRRPDLLPTVSDPMRIAVLSYSYI